VCCLHSARAVLPTISRTAVHRTTGFVNHIGGPNVSVPGNKSVPLVFLPGWAKLSKVQMCSSVQICWRMVRKVSCFMRYIGENGRQDSPCMQTAHKSRVECFNRTSFCIWLTRIMILCIGAVFAKVMIILP